MRNSVRVSVRRAHASAPSMGESEGEEQSLAMCIETGAAERFNLIKEGAGKQLVKGQARWNRSRDQATSDRPPGSHTAAKSQNKSTQSWELAAGWAVPDRENRSPRCRHGTLR